MPQNLLFVPIRGEVKLAEIAWRKEFKNNFTCFFNFKVYYYHVMVKSKINTNNDWGIFPEPLRRLMTREYITERIGKVLKEFDVGVGVRFQSTEQLKKFFEYLFAPHNTYYVKWHTKDHEIALALIAYFLNILIWLVGWLVGWLDKRKRSR